MGSKLKWVENDIAKPDYVKCTIMVCAVAKPIKFNEVLLI